MISREGREGREGLSFWCIFDEEGKEARRLRHGLMAYHSIENLLSCCEFETSVFP